MTVLPRRRLKVVRSKAGWSKAGWSKAGWSKAGWSKAGWSKAGRVGLLLSASLGVARCAEPPPVAPVPTIASKAAPAPASLPPASPPAAASGVAAGPDADGKPVLFNDPPARPDTPLCGRQAQEANAIGAGLQGSRVAASGICAGFACYDPLTATYIGADGYRHVCR